MHLYSLLRNIVWDIYLGVIIIIQFFFIGYLLVNTGKHAAKAYGGSNLHKFNDRAKETISINNSYNHRHVFLNHWPSRDVAVIFRSKISNSL